MKNKHSLAVRKRAFSIWQRLGHNPWEKPVEPTKKLFKSSSGDFYKGAIPFLNADTTKTFKHILLRPGYMIKDYVNGNHKKFLAPLTSLIVFFSFFALITSLFQPIQKEKRLPLDVNIDSIETSDNDERIVSMVKNTVNIVERGYVFLHLDEHPEYVTKPYEVTISALEGALRHQGIPLFISKFFFLWFAMGLALRRYNLGMSAYAAASAYILCQFCFFLILAALLTFGGNTSISIPLMLLLLTIDYHQWLGTDFKKSLKLSISTGIYYGLLFLAMLLIVSVVIVSIAWFKG